MATGVQGGVKLASWAFRTRGRLAERDYPDEIRRLWILAAAWKKGDRFPLPFRFRLWSKARLSRLGLLFTDGANALERLLDLGHWVLAFAELLVPAGAIGFYIYRELANLQKQGVLQAGHIDAARKGFVVFVISASLLLATKLLRTWHRNATAKKKNQRQLYRESGYLRECSNELLKCAFTRRGNEHSRETDNAKRYLAEATIQRIAGRLRIDPAALRINVFVFDEVDDFQRMKVCVRSGEKRFEREDTVVLIEGTPLDWVTRLGLSVNIPSMDPSFHPFNIPYEPINLGKYLFPITFTRENVRYVIGVISVESEQPFCFYSRSGREMEDLVSNLKYNVKWLLGQDAIARQVEFAN